MSAVVETAALAPSISEPLWLPAGTRDMRRFAEWVQDAQGRTAIDTETNGLDPRAEGFRCKQVAFGCSDGSSVVVDGSDKVLVKDALRIAFAGNRKWYAHNAAYDVSVIWACYRVYLGHLYDTLTAARCAWPGRLTYSLKVLRPETEDELNELRSHWEQVSGRRLGKATDKTWLPKAIAGLPEDDPFVLRYIATDAVACARLAEEIGALPERSTNGAQSRRAVIDEVRQDLLWRHVSVDGIRADRKGLREKLVAIEAVIAASSAKYGVDLSKNSKATRQWVADLGIICKDRAGKDTLSQDAWDKAQVPQDAAEAWRDFRAVRQASADLNKVNELLAWSARDGRIYPSVGVNAADQTGRMSIRDPAVQNLTLELRSYLLADEGNVLVGLDLDQVEPRVAAALSRDDRMRGAILSGDVYTSAAEAIWSSPCEDDGERAWRRKTAKTVLLAQLYGQGASSLAAVLGISQAESRRICGSLLSAWEDLDRWIASIRSKAQRGEPVHTWSGRLLPKCEDAPYKAVNWCVQGSSADIFKAMVAKAAVRLREFPGARLWLPVHDELVVECRAEDAGDVANMLGETMRLEIAGVVIGGQPAVLGPRWLHA